MRKSYSLLEDNYGGNLLHVHFKRLLHVRRTECKTAHDVIALFFMWILEMTRAGQQEL